MDIQLNGQPLDVDGISPATTLADFFSFLEPEIRKTGLNIQEIVIDEKAVSIEEALKNTTAKVEAFNKIEIFASTLQDVIAEALEDSEAAIAHIKETALKTAEQLRLGNIKDAMQSYIDVVDGLTWASSLLVQFSTGYADSSGNVKPAAEHISRTLAEKMDALTNAQGMKDWVTLADVLEYEIPEWLDVFQPFLQKLKGAE